MFGLHHLVGQCLHVTLYFVVLKPATDKALHGEEGVLWVRDCLTLGEETHQAFSGFTDRHHRWGSAIAFLVFDDRR